MLSDWTGERPMTVLPNRKKQSDYYYYRQRTVGGFFKDAGEKGSGVRPSGIVSIGATCG